jgi:sterol desaturase/sphingolipid hydroxylase (fatty acid hydroxylase superfamily)
MGIIQASIPLFFLFIAAELLYAQLGRRPFYRLNDSISDLSAGTLSQIAGVFTKVLLLAAYAGVYEHARLQRFLDLPSWPHRAWRTEQGTIDASVLLVWGLAFVAVDLAYYWFHRVSHEVNLFWAGHIVHHSSEEYNLAVALRQSAVGGLLSWIFYVPLAVLGLPWEPFAVCYALNLIYQFWIHTRAIHRLPAWCEAVLNTPSHHRVHHGVNPEYQDRNYAGVFIVWDRLFGTWTPERQEPVYGLTTPLRSWNPLWAQIHHYVAIARHVWHATTWRDRWQYVFGPPAWRPAEQGGPLVVPPVTRESFAAFDPAVPRALTWYALAHFALAVPAALWFLAEAGRMPAGQLAAGAFYLALALTNVGGVLEARRWAFASEQARVGALAVAGVVIAWRQPVMGGTLTAVCLLSLTWLWGRRADFTGASDERMDLHPT